ncbi:hypothetical protein AAE478_006462 [Parahypoxylon ruwenzoriense]
MRRSVLTAFSLGSIVGAIPAPQPQATPPPQPPLWQDGKLKERQQVPFSVPGVIPSAVDTRFYSLDGSTTKFIGSTTAYLSVPTVTGTLSGKTITTTQTASMALFSAKPNGQSDYEYSLVVAPELADEITAIFSSSKKRDLDERAVSLGVYEALVELLGAKMATSVLRVVNLGVLSGVPAFEAVAAGVVELGPIAIAGAAFLGAVANQFSLIAEVWKNGDPRAHAVIVPNPHQNFRDVKTCPSTRPKCSTCSGKDFMCTSGTNNRCPCENDNKCKTGRDKPDCNHPNCDGSKDKVCTTGDQKGCACGILEMADADPMVPNANFLDKQQAIIQKIIDGLKPRGSPSNNPSCGDRAGAGLAGYTLLGHHSINANANATPRQILYMMRETLCNDKCEKPSSIQSKSVKATKKGKDGCEIAVALTGNMEAWAVRDTHSQGLQWQDCWDSLANATEKCANMDKQDGRATGWVNGPDDYEFFQIGYRSLNGGGSLHSKFSPDDALPQWCGNSKPKCDTCYGGGSGNRCTQGEFSGCDCESVKATQPSVPKVTNCATAVAAAEIICCGWSDDTKKTCSQMMAGCGINADLGAICQSPVDPSGGSTYSVCGQFNKGDGILKGTNGEDIATCLDKTFNLKAEFKYQ